MEEIRKIIRESLRELFTEEIQPQSVSIHDSILKSLESDLENSEEEEKKAELFHRDAKEPKEKAYYNWLKKEKKDKVEQGKENMEDVGGILDKLKDLEAQDAKIKQQVKADEMKPGDSSDKIQINKDMLNIS